MGGVATARAGRRLPVAAFVLVALGLVVGALLLYRSMHQGARQRAGAELQSVGALKVAVVGTWTHDQLSNAALAGGYPSVAEAVRQSAAGPIDAELHGHVREVLANLGLHFGYLRVALLSDDGRPLAEWSPAAEADDPFPPALARAALVSSSGTATALLPEPRRERPVLDAATVVRAADGAAAVLAVRTSMAKLFTAVLQSWPTPSASANTGVVHAEADHALLYSTPGGESGEMRTWRVPRQAREVPAARAASGQEGLVDGVDALGRPVLASIHPLPWDDWHLVTKIDLEEIYAPLRRPFAIIVTLAALLLCAGAVLLGLWWRTERGRAGMEAELRESRDLFQLALAGTFFVWDWDLAAGRLRFEKAWALAVGRPSEVVTGDVETIFRQIVHPDDVAEVRARLEAHVRGETELFEAEHRPRGREGAVRWLATRGRGSRRGADGRAQRVTGVVSDMSAQHALRAQVTRAERLASLGTLAAGVAHEINNPLSYVLANLEYLTPRLREAGLEPELLEALGDMRDGAERVRDVVRGLRVFSRPGEGPKHPIDVRVELEAAVRLAANEIRHRARLEQNIGRMPPVVAGPHELGQVFLNLLVNAAQAIPEGHALENRIAVEAGTDPSGWARIEIRDTGGGMSPEVVRHVFEPFFTTKPTGSGTGLGLAIAHGIVGSAGGHIEVESREAAGTTMRVLLPPAPGETPILAPPDAASPGSAGLRLLVVDDDPLVARALTRALGRHHQVTTAGTAAQALSRIEGGEEFDALFCDVMMPQMSGPELFERLAARDARLARRMVFITGGAFTEGAASFLRNQANPCVAKPFQTSELEEALAQVMAS